MDVAVAGPHRSQRRPEISAHGVQHRFAEGKATGAVANKRRKDVALAQSQSGGDAQGFLAASEKNAAVNFAHAIKTGEFVIEDAREQHQSICLHVRSPQ